MVIGRSTCATTAVLLRCRKPGQEENIPDGYVTTVGKPSCQEITQAEDEIGKGAPFID